MRKKPTAADVAVAWAAGVLQCAEATGVEVIWLDEPLTAFAYRKPLSNKIHFCCPSEVRDAVDKKWAEINAGSGSRV